MSAMAKFYKIDKALIDRLVAASRPVKRFLRRPLDNYHPFLEEEAQRLAPFEGDGFLFAVLLPYLDERGLKLLDSDFKALAETLSEARGATHLVFTLRHREDCLSALDPSNFQEADLRAYYEAFNEEPSPEAGAAMLEAIAVLRENLARVDEGSIILLAIV